MRIFFLCLLLLLPNLCALAAPADDIWMSVLLDGRKIGHLHTTRTIRDGSVITTQKMEIALERAGVTVALSSGETDAETPDGEPLAFASRTVISGIASMVNGVRRSDGRFDVVSEVGGAKQARVIGWPPGALLAEGLRLSSSRDLSKPGTQLRQLAFQIESLDAVEVDSTVGARERVDLPDGAHTLMRVNQIVHMAGAPSRSTSWVDADGTVYKMIMPLLGYELTTVACSQACALAPNQGTDILVHALARAPAAIAPADLRHGIVIDIAARDGTPLQFAQTSEQRVRTTAQGVELRIAPLDAGMPAGPEAAPIPADTQPDDWLQSDAPQIRKLAQEGVGSAKTPLEQMQNLQEFVRRFIRTKDLNVGYASALEVAKNPEGDCTEHAVLLAALGRALGIPTRVVDGLAYVGEYIGADHVFVPHAWMQAYIDGHWRSFDAALPGFDAGHIALFVGDGDPWQFFAGMDTLGRMRIERVTPLSAAASGAGTP
ncbi:MAG: transglutaminase-like domain-containing protein [Rudaea sp.]